jgi:hypothetical protein
LYQRVVACAEALTRATNNAARRTSFFIPPRPPAGIDTRLKREEADVQIGVAVAMRDLCVQRSELLERSPQVALGGRARERPHRGLHTAVLHIRAGGPAPPRRQCRQIRWAHAIRLHLRRRPTRRMTGRATAGVRGDPAVSMHCVCRANSSSFDRTGEGGAVEPASPAASAWRLAYCPPTLTRDTPWTMPEERTTPDPVEVLAGLCEAAEHEDCEALVSPYAPPGGLSAGAHRAVGRRGTLRCESPMARLCA